MSFIKKQTIEITTDASGDGVGYSEDINGRIICIIYEKDDFADTVDFAITAETTGQNIWTEENVTASKTVAPRQPTHAADGSESLFAASGEPVEDFICLPDERVKVVVANGGNAKNGAFTVVYE